MGIPIKKYIDISTAVLDREGSNYDTSALMFVSTSMKEGAPEEKVSAFATGDVLRFSSADDVKECWSSGSVTNFAEKYFGTNANGRSPDTLYIVNAIVTFGDLIEKFDNFGSFCKEDMTREDGIVSANYALGRKYVYLYATTNKTSQGESMGCHGLYVGSATDITDTAVVAAWIATRDYDSANALGTIDYTEFDKATASVSDGDTKDELDGANLNYIGKVQLRGVERSFYQTGVNENGDDLGVYCDSAWIQSEIETGWINLALGATKIPFNDFGAMRVRAMIIEVAERGLYNGAILVDKPFTQTMIDEINTYAGTEDAATSVQTTGYYVATRLLPEKREGKFVCRYTLIYAKGDHIQKIVGNHLLA